VDTRSFKGRLLALLLDTNGNTPVETALVIVVIFIPLVIGLFSCSMALVSYQQLGYATITATQTLAEGRGILTDPCKTAASIVTSHLSTWNQANFTYTVTITSTVDAVNTTTSYGPYTGTVNATCPTAATSLTNAIGDSNGNPVTLHMTYSYTWFPIFGKKITGNLAAEDTMLVS
jgi:Flp pilus assembly protein TadG